MVHGAGSDAAQVVGKQIEALKAVQASQNVAVQFIQRILPEIALRKNLENVCKPTAKKKYRCGGQKKENFPPEKQFENV